MLHFIIVLIIAFIWSFIDSFLLFIPPVTFGIAGLMTQSEFPIVSTVINGIAIGSGTVAAIIFYRGLGNKIEKFKTDPKITKWRRRITILIDEIGYQMIIPLAATSLIGMVCYTFVFVEHINYKKLLIYIIIGRSLLLAITAFGVLSVTSGEHISFIVSIIIYGVMFIYIAIVLFKHRHVIKTIKESELLNEENN